MSTVVLTTGCFDLLHWSHVAFLRAARALGTRLVVGVTCDVHAARKGAGRPVFGEAQRAFLLRSLRCVDEAVIYYDAVPYSLIRQLRPAIYAKGDEYRGALAEEHAVIEEGGKCVFIRARGWSSSRSFDVLNEGRL